MDTDGLSALTPAEEGDVAQSVAETLSLKGEIVELLKKHTLELRTKLVDARQQIEKYQRLQEKFSGNVPTLSEEVRQLKLAKTQRCLALAEQLQAATFTDCKAQTRRLRRAKADFVAYAENQASQSTGQPQAAPAALPSGATVAQPEGSAEAARAGEVRAVAAQPLQSLQVGRTDQGLLSRTSVKALDTHLKICEDRCDVRDRGEVRVFLSLNELYGT